MITNSNSDLPITISTTDDQFIMEIDLSSINTDNEGEHYIEVTLIDPNNPILTDQIMYTINFKFTYNLPEE